MMKFRRASLMRSLIYTMFLVASLGADYSLAAETCQPLSEPDKANLSSYVQKKYKLSEPPSLDDSLIKGGCYREMKFHSQNPQKPFAITLYLPPDHKYLLSGLLDVRVDPAEEERKKNQALMETLTRGSLSVLGAPEAPVTIVEFADFQCPYCARAAEAVKSFLASPDGKNVRLVYRHFPLNFHPWAKPAAEAAACVNFQGSEKFWLLHDWIFENQKSLTAENAGQKLLEGVRTIPGIDVNSYQSCIENSMSAAMVQKDMTLGTTNEVRGTPTFFINGKRVAGLRSAEDLRALVAQTLNEGCSGGKCATASAAAISGTPTLPPSREIPAK